jgi:hypothetical protein
MRSETLLVSIACLAFIALSQFDEALALQRPADYLGQPAPGSTAELFAPGLVSTEEGELNSVFTGDLREFYFTRRGIPGVPARIMVSTAGPQGWSDPRPVGFHEGYSAIDLFITPEGDRMVFCSNRPREGEGDPRRDHDFWVALREGEGWGEPRLFAPAALSDWEDYYPVLTASGTLYFNSQRAGPGTNNIFRSSFMDGVYGPAEALPEPINTRYREFDAFVSQDEEMILFSSDRPGGLGRADLYVSYLSDGVWSEPRNLGPGVNSEASEYGATLSPDGRYLFFTSSKGGTEDIYWVSAESVFAPASGS